MVSIRVRFITTDGFVSTIIRKVTGSLFSHCEFGTPEGTWIGALVKGGIQERAADYCTPTREYIYEIPSTDVQEHEGLAWMRSMIGTKYNKRDIAGLMFQARSVRSPHSYICSQFCVDGLLGIFGVHRVLNVLYTRTEDWTYRITPEILHLSPIFAGCLASKRG